MNYLDISCVSSASWLSSGSFNHKTYEANNRRWRIEKTEAAFLSLANHFKQSGTISHVILCHTNIVVLLAPIDKIYDVSLAATNREKLAPMIVKALETWQMSNDCSTALIHASEVLKVASQVVLRENAREASSTYVESPHDAHCIFLCALVTWARYWMTSVRIKSVDFTWLATAIKTISNMEVSIAANMKEILSALPQLK